MVYTQGTSRQLIWMGYLLSLSFASFHTRCSQAADAWLQKHKQKFSGGGPNVDRQENGIANTT